MTTSPTLEEICDDVHMGRCPRDPYDDLLTLAQAVRRARRAVARQVERAGSDAPFVRVLAEIFEVPR